VVLKHLDAKHNVFSNKYPCWYCCSGISLLCMFAHEHTLVTRTYTCKSYLKLIMMYLSSMLWCCN